MIGYRIFTVDQNIYQGLGTYMKEMREKGLRLVLILDPGLVIERNNSFYMSGAEKDVYVKWPKSLAPYDKDNINQSPDDVIRYILKRLNTNSTITINNKILNQYKLVLAKWKNKLE